MLSCPNARPPSPPVPLHLTRAGSTSNIILFDRSPSPCLRSVLRLALPCSPTHQISLSDSSPWPQGDQRAPGALLSISGLPIGKRRNRQPAFAPRLSYPCRWSRLVSSSKGHPVPSLRPISWFISRSHVEDQDPAPVAAASSLCPRPRLRLVGDLTSAAAVAAAGTVALVILVVTVCAHLERLTRPTAAISYASACAVPFCPRCLWLVGHLSGCSAGQSTAVSRPISPMLH